MLPDSLTPKVLGCDTHCRFGGGISVVCQLQIWDSQNGIENETSLVSAKQLLNLHHPTLPATPGKTIIFFLGECHFYYDYDYVERPGVH